MPRNLRTVSPQEKDALRRAIADLHYALKWARRAGCPQLVKKIESAIKSAGGAQRHMEGAASREGAL
jgi:hypothetical protein